jgi:hypothetical protein
MYIHIIQIGDQDRISGYLNITYLNSHFIFSYIYIQVYIYVAYGRKEPRSNKDQTKEWRDALERKTSVEKFFLVILMLYSCLS